MEMKSRGISTVRFHDRSEIGETYQWSPTHEQVEAYIRALEWQALQEGTGIQPRRVEKHRAAGTARRPFAFWRYFCGLIALALGCLAWLIQIIYEALK